MSDMTVLILLALVVAAVPFGVQALLTWRCRSALGRYWLMAIHGPVWAVCLLDSVNVMNLPQTHVFFGSFWNDPGAYALLGVPITFGLLIGHAAGLILRRMRSEER